MAEMNLVDKTQIMNKEHGDRIVAALDRSAAAEEAQALPGGETSAVLDSTCQLLIDGTKVVDNDGGHSARRAEGKVALEAGLHELLIRYFEDYMGQALEVGYSSRDIQETPLPASILFQP